MSETRVIVEQRHADGQWRELGTSGALDTAQQRQIALVLSGIDLAVFASLTSAAQARVLDQIMDQRPPQRALD